MREGGMQRIVVPGLRIAVVSAERATSTLWREVVEGGHSWILMCDTAAGKAEHPFILKLSGHGDRETFWC
jgi:hypothetical protein